MSGDPKRAVGGGLDPSPDMYAIGLRCSQFSMSTAQLTYQREAKRERETMVEELYFYKDATPKGDHYITFVVDLPDRFSESEVLLKVELVSASRTVPIGAFTARGYERVAEQQHLTALTLQSQASRKSTPTVVATAASPSSALSRPKSSLNGRTSQRSCRATRRPSTSPPRSRDRAPRPP